MRRREFILALGGAAVWPLAARAQQPIGKIRHLGVLLPGLPEASMGKATRDRLRELGYTEGRDILLEARWERWSGLMNWPSNWLVCNWMQLSRTLHPVL